MTTQPVYSSPRRINVRGASGSGKTQFAASLAARLAVSHIELDALHWGPNWSEPKPEDFRTRVRDAMNANPQGWVIDGSYDSKLGDLVVREADTIVWIDLPLTTVLFRLVRRTVLRMIGGVELWNGNRETWRDQFTNRESIFIWAFNAHRRHRRNWPQMFAGDPRLVRLNTRAAVRQWLRSQEPAR